MGRCLKCHIRNGCYFDEYWNDESNFDGLSIPLYFYVYVLLSYINMRSEPDDVIISITT